MASERLEELRGRGFPPARRGGYDRAEVDAYLTALADWLETDEAKAALAQREIERVGERTGAILTAAQQSADDTLAEARAAAEAQMAEADAYAARARREADAYAGEARDAADNDARAARESAEADATRTREAAEEHARLTIQEADARLERAAREAAERTAGVEAEIAELSAKREQLVTNLESLAASLRATIDGPGKEELNLPKPNRAAAAFVEPPARPKPAAEPPREHDAVPPAEPVTRVEPAVSGAGEDPDDQRETDPVPVSVEETRPYTPPFDVDDELFDDARPPEPLPSGRDPQHRRAADDDPTTDEQRLTELL